VEIESMMRWLGFFPVTLVLLAASIASTASETCDNVPELRKDSAGWELSDDELDAVNGLIDRAESLCAEGKDDEATKLLSEAEHESVKDWTKETLDGAH